MNKELINFIFHYKIYNLNYLLLYKMYKCVEMIKFWGFLEVIFIFICYQQVSPPIYIKKPNNFENLSFHGVTDLNLILWREPYTSRDVCWTEIGTRNLNFLSACCWRAPHCYNRGVCLKSDTQGNKTLRKRDPTQLKSLYLLTPREYWRILTIQPSKGWSHIERGRGREREHRFS